MDWYDTSSSEWYSPNYSQIAAAPKKASSAKSLPKLPGGKATKVIAIVLCICLVLGGIGWAVVDAVFGGDKDSAYNDDGMPKSFKTYLDTYYSVSSGNLFSTTMPRVSEPGEFRIELLKNSGSPMSFNEIYRQCVAAVVGLRIYYPDDTENYGWGSGFIASADGYIVTNGHLIDECEKAEILLCDGSTEEAKLVGLDSVSDIAVLKIDRSGLPFLSFSSSSEINVGDSVCAIGNPLGPDFSLSMTSGIISFPQRTVTMRGLRMELIQADVLINNGNSGGPLLNEYGRVIGITNMKYVSNFSTYIEGMSFAVPSDTVKDFVDSVMRNYDGPGAPTIGITVGNIDDKLVEYYSIPKGLYVCTVTDGTDAAKHFERSDIVTKVNGKPVKSVEELSEIKDGLSIGDSISFTVWRDGQELSFDVKLIDSHDIARAK